MCAHLLQRTSPAQQYYRRLTGIGVEVEFLCPACAVQREQRADVSLVAACQACLHYLTDEVGDCQGVHGRPGITERPTSFRTDLVETPLPIDRHEVLDIAPLHDAPGAQWLLLDAAGMLSRLHADEGTWGLAGHIPVLAEPEQPPWNNHVLTPRLYVSHSGRFAAVVHDYGTRGVVVSLEDSRVTLQLHGGDYHHETVPFSFCFLEHDGRTLVVHRTDWNRLDISDAGSGELLTARGPTRYRSGEARPAHYLDYFHGRLVLSPDRTRVVDDGWVWHPVGIPTVWSIEAWLHGNPWEPEGGPSKRALCARDYYWDHAICWIGPGRIAVGGLGDDEREIVDGVRLFTPEADAPSGRIWWRSAQEVGAFPGPRGDFFSDGRRLFSADESGLSVWDLDTGARIGAIAGFRPTRQHTGACELVEWQGRMLRRWKYA